MGTKLPLFSSIFVLKAPFFAPQLKIACDRISQSLGCSTEGVTPETVRELLCCRVAKLTQDHDQSVKEVEGHCTKAAHPKPMWVSVSILFAL